MGSPSNFTRWGITTAMENTFAPCYNFHIASAIQPKSVNTTMPCFNARKYSSLISACHPKMVPKFHLGMSSFQACFLNKHYCARNSICTWYCAHGFTHLFRLWENSNSSNFRITANHLPQFTTKFCGFCCTDIMATFQVVHIYTILCGVLLHLVSWSQIVFFSRILFGCLKILPVISWHLFLL